MFVSIKEDLQTSFGHGSDRLIMGLYQNLDDFPDGIVHITRFKHGHKFGNKVTRIKYYMVGTKLTCLTPEEYEKFKNLVASPVQTYRWRAKGVITLYLDKSDRIVIYDDTCKSIG